MRQVKTLLKVTGSVRVRDTNFRHTKIFVKQYLDTENGETMQLLTAFIRFYFQRSPRNATVLRREIKTALMEVGK